jgi:hypothetical protein
MQNKNKVVLPEVGVSWRTTPNTKRSLNFLIFTTFSLVFQSYRKIKTKDCCVFTKFLVFLGFHTGFSNILKIKNNRLFFPQIFFFLKLHTCFFKPKNQNKGCCGFTIFFFSLFFLGFTLEFYAYKQSKHCR